MMPNPLPSTTPDGGNQRLASIERARQAVMQEHAMLPANLVAPWIERSWRRCISWGHQTQDSVTFNPVSQQLAQATLHANRQLVQSAKPILESLARAIVNTRYFAILTNAQGVVVDASGAIDHADPRAHLITRVGADLSERSIGTTAIGTALTELQPVWLHRGEHFFQDTSHYSCAGAPLFGPNGACVGMLDVTGIDAQERPELKHLVRQSACKIENALLTAQHHSLLLRLNWPGNAMGSEADGLLCLDADGWITGANRVARQMVPGLTGTGLAAVHVSEVFGLPFEQLFDAAKRPAHPLELPLWSGLRLQAHAIARSHDTPNLQTPAAPSLALRDVEATMIRKALDDARGNVGQAARALGISRATLYRKLGAKDKDPA
ncbi:helix-turn-helix domain-containing protein [Rhodoferax sp.]|uniref:sigma-54-dependent Fis family transcriptional regulator n=1 Tax=Rhodoferax sp. TaxID=50421 RepID=UPI002628D1BB|nr:helix-turn-helix domain-containing protein [Rhodoferax sp.]MDD2808002.1 helix-turn-helix domain-containing protein [Rhodoferax sp.]MDD4943001.1 helix-turn-helix domain-containing protein [Rhodoferax sp.]